jgi:inositol transport system permease protein
LSFSGAQHRLLAFASLIALVAVFSLASPNFMQTSNIIAILQATSVNGVLAIAATLVIITGGIDLSVGTLMTFCAVIAGMVLTFWGMPLGLGVLAAVLAGACSGTLSGTFVAKLKIPPFIATLGMMVTARGLAKWYTRGQPVSMLSDSYAAIGSGIWPVVIFLVVALIFHIALRYTRYGKFTYAIGANVQAARVSGIDVGRHLIKVYAIAGLLAGLAGVVTSARAISGQAGMGVMYELDAIAAAVIGGASLSGGVGRITGTVIGTIILGVVTSGFTFLKVGAYYQEIVKGMIIVTAVVIDVYRQKRKGRV